MKWFAGASASGQSLRTILIIANENMDEEDLIVEKVVGLTASCVAGEWGHLVIMKSRQGNAAYYRWLMTDPIIEFVRQQRERLVGHKADASVRHLRASCTMDGEQTQLVPFEDPQILALYESERIDVVKNSASCSARQNELDNAKVFMQFKKMLVETLVRQWEGLDLAPRLSEIFETHGIPREKRKNLIMALSKVVYALQNVPFGRYMQSSFNTTGRYPRDRKRMLKMCVSPWTKAELDDVDAVYPQLLDAYRLHGHIPERLFDDLGIPEDEGSDRRKKPKDQRVLSSQRNVWLTHKQSQLRREEWLRSRDSKKSAVKAPKIRDLMKGHEITKLASPQPRQSTSEAVPSAPIAKKRGRPPRSATPTASVATNGVETLGAITSANSTEVAIDHDRNERSTSNSLLASCFNIYKRFCPNS